MTITTSDNLEISLGDGVSTVFSVPFRFFAASDLLVFVSDAAGNDGAPLTLNVDYTVTGAGDADGGAVTFAVAPPAGRKVMRQRDVVPLQVARFVENDGFPAATHEMVLDSVTAAAQDARGMVARQALFPRADGSAPGPVPGKALRAGRVASYDGDGNPAVSNLTLEEIEEMPAASSQAASRAEQAAAEAEADRAETQALVEQALISSGIGFLVSPSDPADMNISIGRGTLFDGATVSNVPVQNHGPIVAPVDHPRIDRITVDRLTGDKYYVVGAEAAVPVPPLVPPGKLPCAQVKLAVGQTAIGIADLLDERAIFGAPSPIGKQTISIPALAMTPNYGDGPFRLVQFVATNDVILNTLDFDPLVRETAQFSVTMPKGWNGAPPTAQFYWFSGAAGTAVWGVDAYALGNDDPLLPAFGAPSLVTDTCLSLALTISPETPPIVPAGTPAGGDLLFFRVFRAATDAADTLAADTRLLAVKIFYVTNVPTDD